MKNFDPRTFRPYAAGVTESDRVEFYAHHYHEEDLNRDVRGIFAELIQNPRTTPIEFAFSAGVCLLAKYLIRKS